MYFETLVIFLFVSKIKYPFKIQCIIKVVSRARAILFWPRVDRTWPRNLLKIDVMQGIVTFCENIFIASGIQIFRFLGLTHLVAFAISLDRDGVKFGLGDDGDLSVEVDAKIKISFWGNCQGNSTKLFGLWEVDLSIRVAYLLEYLLSGHDDFWGLNTDFWHFSCFWVLTFSDLFLRFGLLLFPPFTIFTILFLLILIFIIRHTFKLST